MRVARTATCNAERLGRMLETRVVLYRCANATATFARKELSYGEVREEPQFSFVDGRSGYTEGLRRTSSGPIVFQRDAAKAPLREPIDGGAALEVQKAVALVVRCAGGQRRAASLLAPPR